MFYLIIFKMYRTPVCFIGNLKQQRLNTMATSYSGLLIKQGSSHHFGEEEHFLQKSHITHIHHRFHALIISYMKQPRIKYYLGQSSKLGCKTWEYRTFCKVSSFKNNFSNNSIQRSYINLLWVHVYIYFNVQFPQQMVISTNLVKLKILFHQMTRKWVS